MAQYEEVLDGAYSKLMQIKSKRDLLKEVLEEMPEDEKQANETLLSYVIMKGVSEDLEEFLELLSEDSKPRYQHFIIRNITEHIIEYMYLMNHKELIPEYFGEKAEIDVEAEVDMRHISEEYKNLGQNRYSDKRMSVNAMAVAIGEKHSEDGVPGLYDIFSIISENCHNSYFHAVIDEMADDQMQNKVFSLWIMTLVLVKLLEFEHTVNN